jgi:uncharacterized RDD family membrane protein YckC
MATTFGEGVDETQAGDFELSGWWRRVWAQIIDALIALGGLGALGALGEAAGSFAVGITAGIAWYVLYFTVGHGSKSGQTLGKKMLGIAVKGDIIHARIGYGRAFGRLLALLFFGVLPVAGLLNILWPLWDREHQAWHDKLADTVVVRARAEAQAGLRRSVGRESSYAIRALVDRFDGEVALDLRCRAQL